MTHVLLSRVKRFISHVLSWRRGWNALVICRAGREQERGMRVLSSCMCGISEICLCVWTSAGWVLLLCHSTLSHSPAFSFVVLFWRSTLAEHSDHGCEDEEESVSGLTQ